MFLPLFFLAALAAQSAPGPDPSAKPGESSPFGEVVTLDERALERSTAREDLGQVATADQAAAVLQSSVSGDVRTGTVSMSDNAFQNVSGLAIINANTGNNVAINAAMNVNISISQAQ